MLRPKEVTPHRKTYITVSKDDRSLAELPYGLVRKFQQIASGKDAFTRDVRLRPALGWRLTTTPIHELRETAVGALQVMKPVTSGGNLELPSSVETFNTWASPLFMPGATTGASPLVSALADVFHRIILGVGDVLGSTSTALLMSTPTLSSSDDYIVFDRRAKTTMPNEIDEEFMIRFQVPGSGNEVPQEIARIYFSGPATRSQKIVGTGQYAVRLMGNGVLRLEERCRLEDGSYVWKVRKGGTWTNQHAVGGSYHAITIAPSRYSHKQGKFVGVINIDVTHEQTGNRNAPGGNLSVVLQYVDPNVNESNHFSYKVYQEADAATQSIPIMLDQRRSVNGAFQFAQPLYVESGVIVDAPFVLPQKPRRNRRVRVSWIGDTPDDTHVSVLLLKAGDDVNAIGLSTVASGTYDNRGGWATFDVDVDEQIYRVKLILTSSSNRKKSPTVREIRVAKDGVLLHVAGSRVDCKWWTSVEAYGPTLETGAETANVVIEDVGGNLLALTNKIGRPISIETEYYDPSIDWSVAGNANKRVVIAEGYIMQKEDVKKGSRMPRAFGKQWSSDPADQQQWPNKDWWQYNLSIGSHDARWQKQLCPNWNFGDDPDSIRPLGSAVVPYKATTVINYTLQWGGYDFEDQIDIGPGKTHDYPIRIWPKVGDDSGLVVHYGQNAADVGKRMAIEYLGAVPYWDSSLSESTDPANWTGMWTLIMPKLAPYKNLAYFDYVPPSVAGNLVKSYESIEAWGEVADPAGSGRSIPSAGILKRTLRRQEFSPECNLVTISTTGDLSPGGYKRLETVSMANYRSYNFDPGTITADPNSLDYLTYVAPLVIVDQNLSTPEAIHWAVRRFYDYCCHGRKVYSFISPAIFVVDPDEPKQRKPRKLRYYDPVWVLGEQCLVRKCDYFYARDHRQMMKVEVEVPNEGLVGTRNATEGTMRLVSSYLRRSGVFGSTNYSGGMPRGMEDNARTIGQKDVINAYGASLEYQDVQDLRSGSATFGKPYFLPGYDAPSSDLPIRP
jgi:hypothetical protein